MHVPVEIMVDKSIAELNKREGSSLRAIKKKMEEKYMVDTKKLAFSIKEYIL